MSEISNPHDRFFREVFSRLALAREFLSKQLPAAIVASIDFATLDLRPGSFLEEELQQYFSDLLFRATLQTGQGAYVYILLEHKSYPEWFTGLQLLRYQVEIWEQVRKEAKTAKKGKQRTPKRTKLPPIFPLVVYQHKAKWHAPQQFHDLIEAADEWQPYLPAFKYELVSVASLRETELFSAVLLRAAIRLMRHIFDPDLADKLPQIWAEFRNLAWGPETQGFLIVMLSYVTSATSVSNAELIRSLETAAPGQEETLMTTLAREWMEEGIAKGIEKGLLSSIRTGLRTRFGEEGEALMDELANLHDQAKLQQIVSLLFEVGSLTEFRTRCRALINQGPVANGNQLN